DRRRQARDIVADERLGLVHRAAVEVRHAAAALRRKGHLHAGALEHPPRRARSTSRSTPRCTSRTVRPCAQARRGGRPAPSLRRYPIAYAPLTRTRREAATT